MVKENTQKNRSCHAKDAAMHIVYDGLEHPSGVLLICTDQEPRIQHAKTGDIREKVTKKVPIRNF